MIRYKALYKKMMDALKDAGMWLDWADQMKEDCPDLAKFFVESAQNRLETDFPATYNHFKKLCESESEKSKYCLNELVEEHMLHWHDSMVNRIKRW